MSTPHIGAGGSRAHPTYEWDQPTWTPSLRIIPNDAWLGASVKSLYDTNVLIGGSWRVKRISYAGPLYTVPKRRI